MHIRFLAHGTGDPQRASDYLMQATDWTGEPRPVVQVLRGNPQIVAAIASGLPSLHRYTSGIIAWSPEDQPSMDEVNAVLIDFEKVAFAGLKPSQYCWSAVWHGDHLHVLVARVELYSGHAMNIAPPGWQKTFDPLRDYWNFKKGWARPDDPRRKRVHRPEPGRKNGQQLESPELPKPLEKIPTSEEIKTALAVEPDTANVLRDWIHQKVRAGQLRNRTEVVGALKEVSLINRESKNFISVKVDQAMRPVRLRGALFDEDFEASTLLENLGDGVKRSQIKDAPNPVEADKQYQIVQTRIENRARYNRARYKKLRTASVDLIADANEVVCSLNQHITQSEVESERNRSDHFAEIRRILERTKDRVQELAVICRRAVGSIEESLRISSSARHAYLRARKALREVTHSQVGDNTFKSENQKKIHN